MSVVNDEDRVTEERVLYRGESACVYCFDFQDFREATAGETLTAGTTSISSGPSILTIGAPAVISADFEQKDRNGIVERMVPSGKGISVAFTPPAVGGAKGECFVTCLGNFSGGSRKGQRVKFIVK